MLELVFQGMIKNTDTQEQVVHIFYKDMDTLEFQIMLTNNCYTNPNSIHICFSIKIKKAINKASDINADLVTVNSFFGHFVKEINQIPKRQTTHADIFSL